MLLYIRKMLLDLKDEEYRKFTLKLIPNIEENKVIGVRAPKLREIVKKELKNIESKEKYLNQLTEFKYFEEYNIYMYILEKENDLEKAIYRIKEILPFIDNWATCDISAPKVFKKYPKEVYRFAKECINSDKPYIKRYGIGLLLSNRLYDYTDLVINSEDNDEYYVKMVKAWYLSMALVYNYEKTIKYFEEKKIDKWVHNKALQKAIESRQIDINVKEYLRKLKLHH
ncbi:DNA alkylation repair protein [Pseudostreptobacillus sp.]